MSLVRHFIDRLTLGSSTSSPSVLSCTGSPNGVVAGIVGDVCYSTNGSQYVCTVAGNPGTWAVSGGSGAFDTVVPGYIRPQKPVASPSALDDQFVGTSIDPKWTLFDPGSNTSAVQNNGSVRITTIGVATAKYGGLSQPLPADDEVQVIVNAGNDSQFDTSYSVIGLGVIEGGGSDATRKIFHMNLVDAAQANQPSVGWNELVNYSTVGSGAAYPFIARSTPYFLCIQIKKSTRGIRFYSSQDGCSWVRFWSLTMSFDPDRVALLQTGYNQDVSARYRFFRMTSAASGIFGVQPLPTGQSG